MASAAAAEFLDPKTDIERCIFALFKGPAISVKFIGRKKRVWGRMGRELPSIANFDFTGKGEKVRFFNPGSWSKE